MKNLLTYVQQLCQFVLTERISILAIEFHNPLYLKKNLPQIQ